MLVRSQPSDSPIYMSLYHLDFETRSRADLSECGAYRYAEDESTQILMFAIAKDDEEPIMWVRDEWAHLVPRNANSRAMEMLVEAIRDGSLVYAHNAQFERAMLMFRGAACLNLDELPKQEQWRCTAAMARKAALPDSLERIGKELKLETQKDKTGKELIKLFSMPQKDGSFIDPEDEPEKFRQFVEYCRTDVKTEQGVHKKLKPFELTGISLSTFLLDVRLNDRGIPVNVAAAENARRIVDETLADKSFDFDLLTGGLKPTQRQAVKDLLEENGMRLDDMKQPTLEVALEKYEDDPSVPPLALKILKGYMELNYAAAKKVHTILECVNKDGRVRGTLLYHGAGTGRWAGRLIQPQNFKKPSKAHTKVTDIIYKMICQGCSREDLELVFGNPMDAISSCVRHFIQCGLDADFAQVEARIVCWLAGQLDALAAFAKGEDQYIKMAADIYSIAEAELIKAYERDGFSKERDLGKQAVLGCGFQMAWKKFQATCAKYGIVISDELAQKAVMKYRERYDKVKALWYDTDRAARNAITNPGKFFTAGKHLAFVMRKVADIPFLCMTLPSKRVIVYPYPKIEILEGGDADRPGITFYGEIKANVWGRVKTYGGKLVENAVQGTAADFMSLGADNAELKFFFEVLTLIHDQALAAARAGKDPKQDAKDFGAALSVIPPWALGMPLKADAKAVPYYKK
jgi:DNA polymerase